MFIKLCGQHCTVKDCRTGKHRGEESGKMCCVCVCVCVLLPRFNCSLFSLLQVAGIISALMVMIVILALGPFLQPLQKVW